MNSQVKTARMTGVWYLALAVAGMLGFLAVRPQLYVEDDPSQTLANLTERPELASLSVGLELAIVVAQALAAVWFFKLFADRNRTAAVAVMAFGLMNAVAIMASATFMATAAGIADDPSVPSDAAGTVGLLTSLSGNAWGIGALFFGLWLIPMGWAVITSSAMPRALGWILVVGGVGYVLSAFAKYAVVDAPTLVVEGLSLLATVGEFWMIGYLLIKGIRPDARVASVRTASPAVVPA
jgi:hypothetical protein